jgi:hypothetical protein
VDLKEASRKQFDAACDDLIALSHRIHAHPELGFEEERSSAWAADALSAGGFDVEYGVHDLPTAFVARTGSGPLHAAICCEYDALPDIGHACGHNIICAQSVGAGLALAGLADLPVRVLATWNRRLPDPPVDVPANARLVEWVSYAQTMPHCDVVVCHGGHGTVVRALTTGCVVVAVPAAGDMNENAARIDWAGCGVRVPRIATTPLALRLAVGRALGERALAVRARELGFEKTGFARIEPIPRAGFLDEWLAREFHGGMAYMAKAPEAIMRTASPACS